MTLHICVFLFFPFVVTAGLAQFLLSAPEGLRTEVTTMEELTKIQFWILQENWEPNAGKRNDSVHKKAEGLGSLLGARHFCQRGGLAVCR